MKFSRLLILVVLLVQTSCFYVSMTHLSNDELSFLNCYEVTEDILFVSKSGDLDTMKFTRKNIANKTNPFYISTSDGWIYEAHAGYSFEIKHSGANVDGYYSVKKTTKNQLWNLFRLGSQVSMFDSIGYEYIPIFFKNFTMNGKLYTKCIIADSLNSFYRHTNSNKPVGTEKFVISWECGPIYYKLLSGEEYYRVFN